MKPNDSPTTTAADDVQQRVYALVYDVPSVNAALLFEIVLKFRLDELNDREVPERGWFKGELGKVLSFS